jgi:neutral amino acid transport system permease protein
MLAFILSLVIFAGIFALFSLGLNLQWGYAGLVNFGHVAFMTVGGYATVLLSLNGVPWFLAMLIASGLAALLGLIIAVITLRLRDDYLAIVTIGISEIIRLISNNEEWLTRGTIGIQSYPIPWGKVVSFEYQKPLLAALLIFVIAVVYWRLEWLVRSPWGRVLKAIREDEEVAKALGKNVFWYKVQAFVIGGAIAGMSGAFYAWQLTTIYPESFQQQLTFRAWTIVTIGGAGSNLGVLLGSVIFQIYTNIFRFLPDQIRIDGGRFEAIQLMLIGLTLILLMVWRPQGILGNKDELTLSK